MDKLAEAEERGIYDMPIISGSSHRDGAIYKKKLYWEEEHCVDIADRTESMHAPIPTKNLSFLGYISSIHSFYLSIEISILNYTVLIN